MESIEDTDIYGSADKAQLQRYDGKADAGICSESSHFFVRQFQNNITKLIVECPFVAMPTDYSSVLLNASMTTGREWLLLNFNYIWAECHLLEWH